MPLFVSTMFPLPAHPINEIASSTSPVFTDLFPIVAFVGGILLAVAIATAIVRMLMPR